MGWVSCEPGGEGYVCKLTGEGKKILEIMKKRPDLFE